MASAMATAAARNLPPSYSIHVGPRIRPPRLLPGTKAANTNPQPNEPPPEIGDVWAQGKWRKPDSNAARDRREIQGARTEKALRHATHGMNIYAYSNIRTNQVVYSLTRIMQNNKILPQLLFHGKKTVPAALRRDMWRPYFSIHFSETDAGAETGLLAYRRLRELSIQRQLSPPRDLIMATEEDVKKARAKYTPQVLHEKLTTPRDKVKNLPIKNQMLPQKLRAKKLMDQKASSVADAAFVLGLINKDLSPAERQEAIIRGKERRYGKLSSRAARRLDKIREKEAVTETLIAARQAELQHSKGQLGLAPHTARRIALEQSGTVLVPQHGLEYAIADPHIPRRENTDTNTEPRPTFRALLGELTKPTEFDEALYKQIYIKNWKEQHGDSIEGPTFAEIASAVEQEQEVVKARQDDYNRQVTEAREKYNEVNKPRNDVSRKVQILWADLRDATWAESWSNNVYHGELEQRAALKHEMKSLGQRGTIDEEGNEIPEHHQKIVFQSSTTPHVFGTNNQSGWYETPEKLQEKHDRWRSSKLLEWKESKLEKIRNIVESVDALQQQRAELLREKKRIMPEFEALQRLEGGKAAADDIIHNLNDAEKYELRTSMTAIEDKIKVNSKEILEFETNYPTIYGKLKLVSEWKKLQTAYMGISKLCNELLELYSSSEPGDVEASKRLKQIDAAFTTYSGYDKELEKVKDEEVAFASRVAKYRRKIVVLEQEVAKQQGSDMVKDEHSIKNTEAKIQEYKDLIRNDGEDSRQKRRNVVENTLLKFEQPDEASEYQDLPIALLQERALAEHKGNTEHMENIDRELKRIEEEKILGLVGFPTPQVEAVVQEMDPSMIERGIEMPPPPKKSVWSRVTGLFGR